MARKKFWLGTMGPYYYNDTVQSKAIHDESGNYLTDASISKIEDTIDVMTGITVTKDTIDGVEVVTDVTPIITAITFVTDVTLETS